jgi:hypothetical protein
MARSGNVAVTSTLVVFLCVASMLVVSKAMLQASVALFERRSLKMKWRAPVSCLQEQEPQRVHLLLVHDPASRTQTQNIRTQPSLPSIS